MLLRADQLMTLGKSTVTRDVDTAADTVNSERVLVHENLTGTRHDPNSGLLLLGMRRMYDAVTVRHRCRHLVAVAGRRNERPGWTARSGLLGIAGGGERRSRSVGRDPDAERGMRWTVRRVYRRAGSPAVVIVIVIVVIRTRPAAVGLYQLAARTRARDDRRHPLLLLSPVAEPDSDHFLLELQFVGESGDVGGSRLGLFEEVRLEDSLDGHLYTHTSRQMITHIK